ncbi:MAG TPA: universal stress protein [Burkholderiales bacterium]|nr:universal stress protein [Burkholderiales bacterium]
MYKRILVPVDGSKTSDAALGEAIGLAKDQKAELRVIYVIDEASIVAGSEYGDMLGVEKTQIESGKRVLEKAKSLFPDAETKLLETEAVGQGISEVIVHDADEWGADLIVAGTHGRTGLRHLLMGSVAEGIVRIAKPPVLLIKGHA